MIAGRHDDDLGKAEIFRRVADVDRDALFAQAGDVGIFGLIGALNSVAEIDQHLGDAAHPDAADPDEVDGADVRRHLHGRISLIVQQLSPVLGLRHRRNEIGKQPRRFGDARGSGRLGHARGGLGLPGDVGDQIGQPFWRQVRLSLDDRPTLGRKTCRVGGLIVIERVRIGNEDGRPADHGDLGHRRGARPADDEMRLADPVRHIGEERRDGRGNGARFIEGSDRSLVLGARLMRHDKPLAQVFGQFVDGQRNGMGEELRALAAAEDDQIERFVRLRRAVGRFAASITAGRTGLPVTVIFEA